MSKKKNATSNRPTTPRQQYNIASKPITNVFVRTEGTGLRYFFGVGVKRFSRNLAPATTTPATKKKKMDTSFL